MTDISSKGPSHPSCCYPLASQRHCDVISLSLCIMESYSLKYTRIIQHIKKVTIAHISIQHGESHPLHASPTRLFPQTRPSTPPMALRFSPLSGPPRSSLLAHVLDILVYLRA